MSSENSHPVYNLNVAYSIVRDRLAAADLEEQCRRSDSELKSEGNSTTVTVQYLNQPYVVKFPETTVFPTDTTELPFREQILILHYLAQAKGTAATGDLITFRDLPGGVVYFPTFSKRTMEPLTKHFGREPELLVKASHSLGAQTSDMADTAVTINAFARVPITLLLWHGDEELAPQMNLLFDANITDYLESEDVTVLCEIITWRLVNFLKAP